MKITALTVFFILILFGCATRSTVPDKDAGSKIGDAVTAPLQDLNLVRTKIPAVLLRAKKDPYRRPADIHCETFKTEITELDAALGPDMDARRSSSDPGMLKKGGAMAEESALDALRGTTQGVIPFLGWVRKLSGAERHSKEVASAIASGIVRRAYLKGLGESHGCAAPAAPLPPAQVVEPTQSGTQSNGDAQPVDVSD